MMSLHTIQKMQQDAHRDAAKKSRLPYVVEQEDIDAWRHGRSLPVPFPFIGDYNPPGFTAEGDALFVDSSGFGAQGEAALTQDEMFDKLVPGTGYALVEVGQFQVYIQPFRRT